MVTFYVLVTIRVGDIFCALMKIRFGDNKSWRHFTFQWRYELATFCVLVKIRFDDILHFGDDTSWRHFAFWDNTSSRHFAFLWDFEFWWNFMFCWQYNLAIFYALVTIQVGGILRIDNNKIWQHFTFWWRYFTFLWRNDLTTFYVLVKI